MRWIVSLAEPYLCDAIDGGDRLLCSNNLSLNCIHMAAESFELIRRKWYVFITLCRRHSIIVCRSYKTIKIADMLIFVAPQPFVIFPPTNSLPRHPQIACSIFVFRVVTATRAEWENTSVKVKWNCHIGLLLLVRQMICWRISLADLSLNQLKLLLMLFPQRRRFIRAILTQALRKLLCTWRSR